MKHTSRGGDFVGVACLLNFTREEVLIDAADIDAISFVTWGVSGQVVNGTAYRYAKAKINGTATPLHRVLTNCPAGFVIDHANGNRLDNRRANLRLCSHTENMQNRKRSFNSRTGLKGVTAHGERFQAQIRAKLKRYHLGTFDSAELAHAAYCAAAIRLHGEFARSE